MHNQTPPLLPTTATAAMNTTTTAAAAAKKSGTETVVLLLDDDSPPPVRRRRRFVNLWMEEDVAAGAGGTTATAAAAAPIRGGTLPLAATAAAVIVVTLDDDDEEDRRKETHHHNNNADDDVISVLDDDDEEKVSTFTTTARNQWRRRQHRPAAATTSMLLSSSSSSSSKQKKRRRIVDLSQDNDEYDFTNNKKMQSSSLQQQQSNAQPQQQQRVSFSLYSDNVQRILNIFPDADPRTLQAWLAGNPSSTPAITAAPSIAEPTPPPHAATTTNTIESILEFLLYNPNYPKAATTTANAAAADGGVLVHWTDPNNSAAAATNAATTTTSNSSTSSASIDFMSRTSFEPTLDYKQQAVAQLLQDFMFLSSAGAKLCLAHCHYHYAICHDKVFSALVGPKAAAAAITNTQVDNNNNNAFTRVMAVLRGMPLFPDQATRMFADFGNRLGANAFLKRPRNMGMKPTNNTTNALLSSEIDYVQRKQRAWTTAQQLERDMAMKHHTAQRQGTVMECSCCCDTFHLDGMVACRNEGHLFCTDCLSNFTQQLIFGQDNLGIHPLTKKPALELLCFHGDGCASPFDAESLNKSLSAQTLQKYHQVSFAVSIAQAGLTDTVCECPRCGYCMEVPLGVKVLDCPVATCRFSSCRDCQEPAHIPLRYDHSRVAG